MSSEFAAELPAALVAQDAAVEVADGGPVVNATVHPLRTQRAVDGGRIESQL